MNRSNIRTLTIWGILTGLLISAGMYLTFSKPHLASSSTSTWVWPLAGGVPIQGALFNTTVENTDYGVKNLDLVKGLTPRITCFGVGFHNVYHAGIDLYVPDENGNNTAQGNTVRAVSDGVVKLKKLVSNFDGWVIVIHHPQDGVYSAYWHLTNIPDGIVDEAQVTTGDTIGYVHARLYEGRFPDVHPFTDDAHLHFEIRTVPDLLDAYESEACNALEWEEGVGYTYPNPPEAYGFLDPIAFLSERITTPKIYLPVVSRETTSSTCQPNQDLLVNGNPGFEGPTASPAPWIEISTYFDPYPNLHYYYHIVEEDGYKAYAGNHSAFFGNQVYFAEPVDEQLLQSFVVPQNTETLTWQAYIKLNRDYGGTYNDNFILSLRDAETGINLAEDVVIDFGFPDPQFDGNWVIATVTYEHVGSLAGEQVSLSYTGFADGDAHASTLRVDEVTLRTTTCDPNPQGGQILVNVNVQTVSGTPTPTPIQPSPTPTQTPAPSATPTKTPTPTATVPVDSYEPNNTYEQPYYKGTIGSWMTIDDATISTSNDEDWFAFDVAGTVCDDCVMQVSLSMIPYGANYELELYGDDPNTPLAFSYHPNNQSENLEFGFFEPATWDFKIRIFSVNGASPSQPYHLQVQVASNAALAYEPNNSFRDAFGLSSGTATNPLQAALYPATDEDWFKIYLNPTSPFPAKGHQILTLQLSVPAGADYELALFNEQGVLLTTSIHSGNAPEYISFQITQAGWYYIRVYPNPNVKQETTEPYILYYQYLP